MPGFTVEPLPAIGAVRLVVDVSDFVDPDPGNPTAVDEVQMFRLLVPPTDPDWFLSLRKVRVRPTYRVQGEGVGQYGQPWEMFNTADVWYDCEAPLDVPLWYLVETIGGDFSFLYGYPYANVVENSEFETNVSGWQPDTHAAITWNNGSPIFGVGSLRIRATQIPTAGWTGARTVTHHPVTAGRMYAFSAWLRASGAPTNVRFGVDWLNAAHGYLATTYSVHTSIPGANVPVRRATTAVAPVGAAYAQPRVMMLAPAAEQLAIVDRVTFSGMGPGDDIVSTPPSTILASLGGGWFTEPTEPATDVRLSLLPVDGCDVDALVDGTKSGVIFASHSTEGAASAGARFDVVDQRLPVPITSVRRGPTSTLTLASVSFPDRDAVHASLATGRVTMLRLPPEFGISDRYTDVADVSTSALSQDLRLPYRVIDLPYAESTPPSGPIAGVRGTRFEDIDRYATWTEFDAAGLTSIDLLHGAGSTLGVGA